MPARRRATGHGGARKGAGRKRDVLPADIADRLKSPPVTEPLKLARWYSAVLTEILDLYLRTGRYVEMYREVRPLRIYEGATEVLKLLVGATTVKNHLKEARA